MNFIAPFELNMSTSTNPSKLLLETAGKIRNPGSSSMNVSAEVYESVADNPAARIASQYLYHSGLGRIAVNGFDTLGNFIMNVATYFLSTFTAIIVAGIVKKYSLTDYDYFIAFVIACVVCMSIVMMIVTFKKCMVEKMGGNMDVIERNQFDQLRANLLQKGIVALQE